MGALVATGVHYRDGDVCRPAQVIADNPPLYDEVTLSAAKIVDDAVVHTPYAGVNVDPASPATTSGTWHYPGACPDQ